MRVSRVPPAVAPLAAALFVTVYGQVHDATQVLSATRAALGGEAKLSAVKSFTATGRTRQLRGNNLVPIEFEINVELPDKFVRIDEFPAQDADPTTQGFNGDALLQFPAPRMGPGRAAGASAGVPQGGRAGGPPLSAAQQRVVAVKQDFVRMTLGMFAASFSSYPLTFKYAAEGEAPEGRADILEVAGPANFSVRFVVQRETHLPVMLMWQAPATDAQAKSIDYRVYYGDFRSVEGLKWPFRLRRAIAGETIEETMFDRFKINTKIDPNKFEARK